LLQRASKALFEHTKQPNVDDYPAAGLQVVGLDCEVSSYFTARGGEFIARRGEFTLQPGR
jgi:hypothetical protein